MTMRKYFDSYGITYLGTAASVVLTAAFYVVSLRIDTASFGTLQSIVACMFLLHAGRSAAAGYIVMHATGNETALGSIVRHGARLTLLTALLIMGLFMAAAPFLRWFLHVESPYPFVLIGIAAIPGLLAGMNDGILNVQKRFTALAVSSLIPPSANVILAIFLLHDGLQQNDPGWIILGSQSLSCLNAPFIRWSALRTAVKVHIPTRSSLREVGELLLASLLLGASMRLDIFWAKHTLSSVDAGSYAIAASIAIVLYLVSSGVARVAGVSLRTDTRIRVIGISYALIIIVSGILALGFSALGEPILHRLTGKILSIDWAVLFPLFIAMTCYSLITFDFTCLNILTKRVHVGIGIVLVAMQALSLQLIGTDASSIAWAQCATMAALALVFTARLLHALQSLQRIPRSHPAELHLSHRV